MKTLPKTLRLIPSDFDHRATSEDGFCSMQYTEPTDCPIARALKRRFPDDHFSVDPCSITVNGKDYRIEHTGCEKVREAFNRLKKNKSFVTIKLKMR